jgi:hypothetical protein
MNFEYKKIYSSYEKGRLQIRIRKGPHYFGKLDPDPH